MKSKVKAETDPPPPVANARNHNVIETEKACKVSHPAFAGDEKNPNHSDSADH